MAIDRVRVFNGTPGVSSFFDLQESAFTLDASLSSGETSQFTLDLEDVGFQYLRGNVFRLNQEVELTGMVDRDEIRVEVAARESYRDEAGGRIKITCRARAIQRLKRIDKPERMDNVLAGEFIRRLCDRVGIKVELVGESVRQSYGIDPNETAWDAIKRVAQGQGWIVFEASDTLYVGKPTDLVNRKLKGIALHLADGRRPEELYGFPSFRESVDESGRPIVLTFECSANYAQQFRPGRYLRVDGHIEYFNRRYLITECEWTQDGDGRVTASTPVDPERPQAPATAEERQQAAGTAGGAIDMAAFLYGLRMHESNGDYKAQSPISSASGAYQYIRGTWNGYGGYAQAKDAPPSVQDKRAREDAQRAYDKFGGDWEKVAANHFYPAWANDKSKWNRSPSKGNPTVRKYVDSVLGKARTRAAVSSGGASTGGAQRNYQIGAVKPHVQAAANEIGSKYNVGTIHGFGYRSGPSDHPKGLGLDFMVGTDKNKGDSIAAFVQIHHKRLRAKYIIWYQQINSFDGRGWRRMEDRGSITANHIDHPHVSFHA